MVAPPRDPAYLAWIRLQPCASCYPGDQRTSSEAHHEIQIRGQGGMGRKKPDAWAVPLCRQHHAERHAEGVRSFWGSDETPELIRLYNELYEKERA